MTSPLLALPRHVRNKIYKYVLCMQVDIQLIAPFERIEIEEDDDYFPDELEPTYPPNFELVTDVGVDTSDGAVESDMDMIDLMGAAVDYDDPIFDEVLDVCIDDSDDEDAGDEDLDDEDSHGASSDEDADEELNSEDENEDFGLGQESRFKLEAFTPLDLAILGVNRSIHDQALPVLYGGNTFIITHPLRFIKFCRKTARVARDSIKSVRSLAELSWQMIQT